mmetsp:Transcript_28172/g.31549  ORF Transcript_28172/g.31549 Transcript_28172/m.31549 type:complete len:117 (+) Transcript_28172:432-782(+)
MENDEILILHNHYIIDKCLRFPLLYCYGTPLSLQLDSNLNEQEEGPDYCTSTDNINDSSDALSLSGIEGWTVWQSLVTVTTTAATATVTAGTDHASSSLYVFLRNHGPKTARTRTQ